MPRNRRQEESGTGTDRIMNLDFSAFHFSLDGKPFAKDRFAPSKVPKSSHTKVIGTCEKVWATVIGFVDGCPFHGNRAADLRPVDLPHALPDLERFTARFTRYKWQWW